MGDWFQTIVDRDASLEEARELAREIRDWLVDRGIVQETVTDCVLGGDGHGYPPGPNFEQVTDTSPHHDIRNIWTNGLQLIIGRTVFDPGQGDHNIICPQCQTAYDDHGQWSKAISEWYEGKAGMLRCTHCKQPTPIIEWTFDPPWGFGNLGFVFWNWPPLKGEFISEVGGRLKHHVVVVKGKL